MNGSCWRCNYSGKVAPTEDGTGKAVPLCDICWELPSWIDSTPHAIVAWTVRTLLTMQKKQRKPNPQTRRKGGRRSHGT